MLTTRRPSTDDQEGTADSYDGHPMTGRDPARLDTLIRDNGDDIWAGVSTGDNDRGDRHYRPDLVAKHDRSRRNRKT